MGAMNAPLTIRADVNGSGAGMGAAYVKDFQLPGGAEAFVAYEITEEALMARLTFSRVHVAGVTTASVLSDAQFKPIASSSTSSTITANSLMLGIDRYIFRADQFSVMVASGIGAMFASDDRIVTTLTNGTQDASQVSGVVSEGFSQSLSPLIAAGFSARYTQSFLTFELRGMYTYAWGTSFVSALTRSESQNGASTIIGRSESRRTLDGFNAGLTMSFRLW